MPADFARRIHPDEIADPFENADPSFGRVQGDVRWTVLWDAGRWLEGPAWHRAGRYLVFSDIPEDRLLRYDPSTGAVGVFDETAGHPNGNAFDAEGRLITCQQGSRRIVRTEHDGSRTVLAAEYDGVPLNSPNDLAIDPRGWIWFTDPPYGILDNYEGRRADQDQPACRVYRLDGDGAVTIAAEDFGRPTGIALSVDGSHLHVADSRHSTLTSFEVGPGGRLSDRRELVTLPGHSLDSMAVDEDDRIWIGAIDGVHCYASDGTLLGKIRLPDAASHVAFGGRFGNDLFVCATTALCVIRLAVRGALVRG